MRLLQRVPTGPHGGRKWSSRRGYVFLGIAGDVYAFHLEIGRFAVTVESSAERRANAKARRAARKQELLEKRRNAE